ncbi:hypothetical protein [Enterococcus cecorum]|uniref:hypothetical protein n=1 Tax=Enterococcus cecorum TaxID=44008 RepID=UPI00148D8655|nr:hypothetical protein [Enterococcus cecorum]
MTVKISKLKNKAEKRNIREVVSVNGDIINIFEPTEEDVRQIMEYQEKYLQGDDFEITGAELIKVFFKLLTDIDGIDDLTDEEIDDIVENPSVAFLMVQSVIEGIILDVFRYIVSNARNEVVMADFSAQAEIAQTDLLESVLKYTADKYDASELLEDIKKKTDKLQTAVDADYANTVAQELRNDLHDNVVPLIKKESALKENRRPEREDYQLKMRRIMAEREKDGE